MSDLRKAAREALELHCMALDSKGVNAVETICKLTTAINNLGAGYRAALEAEHDKPVAWILTHPTKETMLSSNRESVGMNCLECGFTATPLYTHPPAPKPLTDDEITKLFMEYCDTERDNYHYLQGYGVLHFARAIEAKGRGE